MIIALYGMFKQVTHLLKYWKTSKFDMVSCLRMFSLLNIVNIVVIGNLSVNISLHHSLYGFDPLNLVVLNT